MKLYVHTVKARVIHFSTTKKFFRNFCVGLIFREGGGFGGIKYYRNAESGWETVFMSGRRCRPDLGWWGCSGVESSTFLPQKQGVEAYRLGVAGQ